MAVYAQDDWKIRPNLTLNPPALELHPSEGNQLQYCLLPSRLQRSVSMARQFTAPWSVPKTGAHLHRQEPPRHRNGTGAIYPTPIFTAKQAGLPETCATPQKDWGPPHRLLAWRPIVTQDR